MNWEDNVLWRKIFLIGYILILLAFAFTLWQVWKYKDLLGTNPVSKALEIRFPTGNVQCWCQHTFPTESNYNATETVWFNKSAEQVTDNWFDFKNPNLVK